MSERWDAVVVGGGVVGLACAWRIAQRGLSVRVVERHRPGSGASWHAAGMLAADPGDGVLAALTRRAAEEWSSFAVELGVDYRRIGSLTIAGAGDGWLSSDECRALEPALAPCAGGLLAPDEAEVDPRALVRALAPLVAVQETRVVGGVWDGGRLAGVRTELGEELECDTVVLATGCWGASWLPAEARPAVRPVKGQILRLLGEPVCERMIRAEHVYLVPRATGELVIGATVEERGFDTTVTAGAVLDLLREAERLLPAIAGLELVEATAGLRPGSPDDLPLVGRGAVDGLVVATGHHRNGILLAPVTADAVAALCAGDDPAGWDAFAPGRFAAARV